MNNPRLSVFLARAALLFAILGSIKIVKASTENTVVTPWLPPVRISDSTSFAYMPFIVADASGQVHIAWSANTIDPRNREFDLDTIFYMTVNNGVFSPQHNIFVGKGGGQTRINRMRIDSEDELHILYVMRPGITYAHAHATNASNPKAWVTNRLSEDAWMADFALDSNGAIHLAYIVNNQAVYYVRSDDYGETWSTPRTIYELDASHSSSTVRIEVGSTDTLHVVVGLTVGDPEWHAEGIIYTRSEDGGASWMKTLEIKEGDDQPNIGFDDIGEIHIVFNNPATTNTGRGHAWSRDDGKTWSRIERICPGTRGLTYWPELKNDSWGTLYLVMAANPADGPDPRTHISEWRNGEWSSPQVISGEITTGEAPSMAVGLGNQLHIVWFTFKQQGIWYTSAKTSSPAIKAKELSVPTVVENSETLADITHEPNNTENQDIIQTLKPIPDVELANPAQPVIIGVFLAIVVFGVIGIIVLLRKQGVR